MDYCLISLWRKNLCISIFFSDEGQSENRPKCLEGGGGGGGGGALDGNLGSGGIAYVFKSLYSLFFLLFCTPFCKPV